MTRKAALVGLVGANIMRSLSPALHEDSFHAHGVSGHYHLIDLDLRPQLMLEQILDAVKTIGFSGINVTFPVKQTIMPMLDEISIDAQRIGAVNTVTISASGRTVGYNTDCSGFRRSFEEGLGHDAAEGRVVTLVGAGGAGSAVGTALMDLGTRHLIVHDVDAARALATVANLQQHFGTARVSMASDLRSAIAESAGMVNATPIGMLGHPGIPVPVEYLRKDLFVADVIYTPSETALIEAARRIGCRVLTGGGMCVHQAADAFRLFSGLEPDIVRMKQTFERALAARDLPGQV
ncbi:MAG TPA: shikimate dehydrogenase [Hyphomicrobiaceae bacterium]|nr:shikimate dehydrogenase [Hyphomicrobiaceae bacterium]